MNGALRKQNLKARGGGTWDGVARRLWWLLAPVVKLVKQSGKSSLLLKVKVVLVLSVYERVGGDIWTTTKGHINREFPGSTGFEGGTLWGFGPLRLDCFLVTFHFSAAVFITPCEMMLVRFASFPPNVFLKYPLAYILCSWVKHIQPKFTFISNVFLFFDVPCYMSVCYRRLFL